MKTFSVIGDSQTDIWTPLGVDGWRTWVPVLQEMLREQGINIRGRQFGVGGETTAQMLARIDGLFLYDQPDLAIIYAGVNDGGQGINQAGTQANLQAMIKALKFGAIGGGFGTGATAATQANLPASGELGQRFVVLSDTSTTGGLPAWHPAQKATITGTVTGQAVWEYRAPQVGERGWGRIATAATTPTHVKKILIISTNYLNYSTNGDNPSNTGNGYTTVRAAQQAAVTAENVSIAGAPSVVYADLYNFMRNRIIAGTDPNFSADTATVPSVAYDQTKSWHPADANQHHNAYGNHIVAQCALTNLPASWLTALAA